jgi:hypothetical protein
MKLKIMLISDLKTSKGKSNFENHLRMADGLIRPSPGFFAVEGISPTGRRRKGRVL